tara:strand:- start:404 stop:778 length:375 start_codon:yes stop_codon:yes gene_type:complete
MYYCSIEDAWGNNFNNKYSVYKQNNIKETQPQLKDTLPNDEKILLKDTKTDNSDLMRNKKISLEKEIEETIEKIYEMKNKKKKLFEKTQRMKGGNNIDSNPNNYILLGLILLFIIDFFGNLSYQ